MILGGFNKRFYAVSNAIYAKKHPSFERKSSVSPLTMRTYTGF